MAEQVDFGIGDKVQHTTGGPKMTVTGYGKSQGARGIHHYRIVEDKQKVICEWWDTNNSNFVRREFAAGVLKKADEGSITPPKVG